jgi:hypothetical protein
MPVADFFPLCLPLECNLFLSLELDSFESLDWDVESLELLLLLDSLADDLPEDDSPEESPEDSSITSFFFLFFSYLSSFLLALLPFSLTFLDFSWWSWMVLTDPASAKLYRASGAV